MARSVDARNKGTTGNLQVSGGHGWDMVTNAREVRANPSLAEGCSPVSTAGGAHGAGSPGAVLGTGSNTDRYTPGIEAV